MLSVIISTERQRPHAHAAEYYTSVFRIAAAVLQQVPCPVFWAKSGKLHAFEGPKLLREADSISALCEGMKGSFTFLPTELI